MAVAPLKSWIVRALILIALLLTLETFLGGLLPSTRHVSSPARSMLRPAPVDSPDRPPLQRVVGHTEVVDLQVDHGVGARNHSKTIVASTLKDQKRDTDWIRAMFSDWDVFIYTVDDPMATLSTRENKGREGSVYLTYIIDHYYNLPDYMLFIHGKRWQWHTDDPMFDTAASISNLSLAHVEEHGYASLRCTWWPGCPAWLEPELGHKDPECWWPGCPVPGEGHTNETFSVPQMKGLFASAYDHFFPHQPMPAKVGAPCCAQFAVTRSQVLSRPRSDYIHYRSWLWGEAVELPASMRDKPQEELDRMSADEKAEWEESVRKWTREEGERISFRHGAIMEHMWHIIFGQQPDMCNAWPAKTCFCQRFGHCDLACPSDAECKGRYWRTEVEKMIILPNGWPEQGQGNGLPYDGWWNDDI